MTEEAEEQGKTVEFEAIINGFNICFISGYITDMKKDKDHTGQDRLNFILVHANTAKDRRYYTMKIKVSFYGAAAENVAKRYKDGMYVIVEGKLRENEDFKRHKITGIHVQSAEWVRKRIKIQIPEEPEDKEAGNGRDV